MMVVWTMALPWDEEETQPEDGGGERRLRGGVFSQVYHLRMSFRSSRLALVDGSGCVQF